MSIVSRQGILKLVVVSLAIVFGLGALPGTIRADTLSELLEGKDIQFDNVVFSNFTVDLHFSSEEVSKEIDLEKIKVVPIGSGTLTPGLKFIADDALTIQSSKNSGIPSVLALGITYEVRSIDDLRLIRAGTLRVNSDTVKSTNTYSPRSEVKTIESIFDENGNSVLMEPVNVTSSGAAFNAPRSVLSSQTWFTSQLNGAGEVSTKSFEQRFDLTPISKPPIAVAGDDQVVFDSVTLDGSKSSDPDGTPLSYKWELFQKEGDELVLVGSESAVQVDFNDLTGGFFYEAKLTVTDEDGDMDADTVLVAAAGACENQGGSLPPINDNLHLWNFKLKQYKYCDWGFARMYGAVDLPEKLHDLPHGKVLNGSVTIVVEDALEGNKPLVISTPTKMKVRNRSRYKTVLHTTY